MSSEGESKLEAAILPTCTELGVSVVDVEFRPRSVTVTVEAEGELDLDRVAVVARAVSDILDADPELGPEEHFELEVTSPGVERRLRRPDHYRSVIGSAVAIRTLAGTPGERRVEGSLVVADDEGVEVAIADGKSRRVAYKEIERARTVMDWQAALREGKERTKREKVAMS